jgi:CheY-like chemotaxis protein
VNRSSWRASMVCRSAGEAVLMGCQMPEVDGYQATAELRRREGTARRTPVIALTAHALPGEREKCLAAGMDDYVVKPTLPADLHAALDRALGQPAAAPVLMAAADQDALTAKWSVLEDMGSPDLMRNVAHLFLRDAPLRLAAMAEAVRAGNGEEAAFAAHALKGTSGNIGAARRGCRRSAPSSTSWCASRTSMPRRASCPSWMRSSRSCGAPSRLDCSPGLRCRRVASCPCRAVRRERPLPLRGCIRSAAGARGRPPVPAARCRPIAHRSR